MTSHALPVGTLLHTGKYSIDKMLGQGGFGITYLATDIALQRRVAVKELFPRGCLRQGRSVVLPAQPARLDHKDFDRAKDSFVKEAQTVARFNHPGIVAVHTAFKENNTAYMVMEYLRGRTLAELLESHGGALSEQDAVRYVTAIGQALREVHEDGVLHRDVKPENVIVTKDGRTVLVDFGAAREFTADVTESIEVVLTSGYAPLEQYGSLTPPGVQADVYALGATLYRLLTGKVPVAAPDRHSGIELEPPGQVSEQVSEKVNKSVLKAMATGALDRYQSMDEFLDALTKNPLPEAPPPAVPASPAVTRGDGSCRATWTKVSSATRYDLRWRQRGRWNHVPNVISPRTIAPLVASEFVEVQVRAQNGTGVSAWSPPGRLPPRPRPPPRWPRIAFGVTLLGIVMVFMWLFVTPDGTGDMDSTDSPEDDLPSPAEPAPGPVERIYPRIGSLVRQEPADYRTSADSLTWRVTFTEAVTNVDSGDFVVTGVKPGRLTVTPAGESRDVYDVTIDGGGVADHNGKVTFGFSHGMYIKNLDGNRLLNVSTSGLYQATFVLDNAGPLVIFHPKSGRIDDANGNLWLEFSEPVYGDASGTAFTAATLAGLIDLRADDESGAPIPFTASIDDNETVTIAPAGALPLNAWVRVKDAYYDMVGKAGLEATTTFTVDTIRPTVTINSVPATDSGAFMATFTFSEAVTGFTASDVAITNGTASALTEARDGLQWHVRIIPTGDYSVSLPADRVTDLAGNGNAASTSREGSYGDDLTDPRLLSIVRQTPPRSPARGDSVTWRVTFSEDVEQFNADSVGLLDHRSQVPIAGIDESVTAVEGSASVYDVTFSGSALANHNDTVRLGFLTRGSRDNWISVNVRDTSNRPLPCCQTLGADERTFDVDNVAPRVADIVRSSPDREHTNDDEVAWTVTFSEPVGNLSAGDFTVSGTDAALSVTPEGSGSRTWSVIASGGNLARLNATIRLSFAGTRDIEDAAGNVLVAIVPTGADESTFVIDNIAPALTSIVRQPPKGSPADAETATWRLTFSDDMRGIEATDFAVHGATIAVVAAGSKAAYELSVSGEDVIPVRVPISVYINGESGITDLAGNALRAPRPPTTIVLPSSAATSR